MPRRRWSDDHERPFTTAECARWMGVTTDYIRGAIDAGELEAESFPTGQRRVIRVHVDDFIAYLQRIGWSRLPRR